MLLAVLALIAGASEKITEEVFGPLLSGKWMKFLSIGMGVALTFGAQAMAPEVPFLAPLTGLSATATLALGIVAGLGANALHALLPESPAGTRVGDAAKPLADLFSEQRRQDRAMSATIAQLSAAYRAGTLTREQVLAQKPVLKAQYPHAAYQVENLPDTWPTR